MNRILANVVEIYLKHIVTITILVLNPIEMPQLRLDS